MKTTVDPVEAVIVISMASIMWLLAIGGLVLLAYMHGVRP